MSEITLHIRITPQERRKVTVPSDMLASELIDELQKALELAPPEGRGRWILVHSSTGAVLNPEATMEQSGVSEGGELVLEVQEAGDLRFDVHLEDGKSQAVEFPGTALVTNLLVTVLGTTDVAAWTVHDKDTGQNLDHGKSLAENKVAEGHQIYLRRIVQFGGVVDKKVAEAQKTTTRKTRKLPWILIVAAAIVLVAGIGVVVLMRMLDSNVTAVLPGVSEIQPSGQQQFRAALKRNTDKVRWSIAPQTGTITSDGLYTAPSAVPSTTTVVVTATLIQDPNKSASANITLAAGGGTVSIMPDHATLQGGGTAKFTATVKGGAGTGLLWRIQPDVGSISSDGVYTAPDHIQEQATIVVKAISATDPGVLGVSSVNLEPVVVNVFPKVTTVSATGSVRFVGTVAGTLDHGIRWTLIGPGTISNTGIYVAPSGIAERLTAMVTATSRADPSKSMTAQVAIQPVVAISISPTAGTLTANQKLRFKPEQTGTLNSTVRWSLAGPGNLTADGEYEAPSAIRAEEAARITVTSVADPNKTATAVIVLQPVSVSILPVSTELKASQTAKFYAATPDGNGATVKWSLNGDGSISQEGLYTAPAMIGTDHDVRITATSLADPSRSATASVQLKRYRGALTGVLTWTGAIEKNGTLTIDDAGASRGVLQGAMLPGIPVMIQLDNPQAFRIFKAPGPSNDWKRLTLISVKGKQSNVRITWTVTSLGGN